MTLDGVEVLGEGPELVPRDPRHQGVKAHIFDVLESPNEYLYSTGSDGCD
jgi:hypothetical protein